MKVRFFQYRQYRHQKSPWSSVLRHFARNVFLKSYFPRRRKQKRPPNSKRPVSSGSFAHENPGGKSRKGHQIQSPIESYKIEDEGKNQ